MDIENKALGQDTDIGEQNVSPFEEYLAALKAEDAKGKSLDAADKVDGYKPLVINGAVFKPIPGAGPQPVVTPSKHVQLQPIVVPIAMVPYATQNQPMVQYSDGETPVAKAAAKQPAAVSVEAQKEPEYEEVSDAEAKNEEVEYVVPEEVIYEDDSFANDGTYVGGDYPANTSVKTGGGNKGEKAKRKKGSRGRSLLMLILSLVYLLPYIFSYMAGAGIKFNIEIIDKAVTTGASFFHNAIGTLINAVTSGEISSIFTDVTTLINIVVVAVGVASLIISIIGLIANNRIKFPVLGTIMLIVGIAPLIYGIIVSGMTAEKFIDGAISAITSDFNVIRFPGIALFVFICTMLLKYRAPKDSSAKKEKASTKKKGKNVKAKSAEVSE